MRELFSCLNLEIKKIIDLIIAPKLKVLKQFIRNKFQYYSKTFKLFLVAATI